MKFKPGDKVISVYEFSMILPYRPGELVRNYDHIITPNIILKPHCEYTVDSISNHGVVLVEFAFANYIECDHLKLAKVNGKYKNFLEKLSELE